MLTARSTVPQHQEPVSSLEMSVRMANPGRRLGWRQRLHLLCSERRRKRFQRLDNLWDAPHERVWTQTADSCRDFVIQESRPVLCLAIYQHVALS